MCGLGELRRPFLNGKHRGSGFAEHRQGHRCGLPLGVQPESQDVPVHGGVIVTKLTKSIAAPEMTTPAADIDELIQQRAGINGQLGLNPENEGSYVRVDRSGSGEG